MLRLGGKLMSFVCAATVATLLLVATEAPAAEQRQIPADVYLDKVQGMWLGELVGNYAGRPVEGSIARGGLNYDVAWNTVLATNPWVGDDDTAFEYMYVSLLGQSASPTSSNIRDAWVANVPCSGLVYIANRQARYLMDPPPTGATLTPPTTGSFRYNMHAYAIDSQITTESLGALAPGLRQQAADLSGTFAAVSNEGFSAHAAQFYAAMYAAGAMESDVPTVIDQALAIVPLSSRTYEVIDAVRAFHQAAPDDWRACQTMLHDDYGVGSSDGRYCGWIESTVNVGLTTMALLYGEGDFQQTVEIGVQGGYDADCNPATAAGLLGIIKGYEGLGTTGGGILAELPTTPADAYDVQCLTSIGSLTTVSQVAKDFAVAAEMQIVAAGGSIVGLDAEKVYLLPDDVVTAPPELPDPDGPGGLVGRMLAAGGTVNASASVSRYIPTQDRNNITSIIDGITDVSYNGHRAYWTKDGDNPQPAGGDWYRLDFSRDMTFNKVVYYEGDILYNGINANPRTNLPYGGFFEDLTVEVLRDGQWQAVTDLAFSEALDANAFYQAIEMTFDPITGQAVRIRGNAGGSWQFTTIVELEVDGAMGVAGDCDEDGLLDHDDLMTFAANIGGPGQWSDGDFNFDGMIDAADYIAMKRSWLAMGDDGDIVPEPTSLFLILAGAALLLNRRGPALTALCG